MGVFKRTWKWLMVLTLLCGMFAVPQAAGAEQAAGSTRLEAENAELLPGPDPKVYDRERGSGGQIVGSFQKPGAKIIFHDVPTPQEGEYQLDIRYGSINDPCGFELWVNGEKVKDIAYHATGAWDMFEENREIIYAAQPSSTIEMRYVAPDGSRGINIDCIDIKYLGKGGEEPAAFGDIAGEKCEEAVRLFHTLGYVQPAEDGTFGPGRSITRAEFLKVLMQILRLDYSGAGETVFSDVPDSHFAAQYINMAARMGLVTGSGGQFYPDDTIAYAEALSIAVNFLGYRAVAESRGSYPAGVFSVAQENAMTRNINLPLEADLSRGTAMVLLLNLLDVKPVSIDTNGNMVKETQTVMEQYLQMQRVRGRVMANRRVQLDGGAVPPQGWVRVGAREIVAGETAAESLLGQKVAVYVDMSGDRDETAVLVQKEDSEILQIGGHQVLGGSSATSISYDLEDGAGKQKVGMDPGAVYVQDFEVVAKGSITPAALVDPQLRITVISDDGSGQVVFLEHIRTMWVDAVSKEDMIYDRFDKDAPLELRNTAAGLLSMTKNGRPVTLGEISPRNIVEVVQGAGRMALNIIGKNVQGEIDSLDGDGVQIAGAYYDIAPGYAAAAEKGTVPLLELGAQGTFYLDSFGRIAAAELDSAGTRLYGYLVNAGGGSAFGSTEVKLFGDHGEMGIYPLRDQIEFNGKRIQNSALRNQPEVFSQPSDRFEAEDAVFEGCSPHTSATGVVSVAYFETPGDSIEFTVSAPQAGTYSVLTQYSFGGQSSYPASRRDILVNGEVAIAGQGFPVIGTDFDTWGNVSFDVELKRGQNAIKILVQEAQQRGINVDYIKVSSRATGESLMTEGIFRPQMVAYKTNAEGEITALETAEDYNTIGKNLYMVEENRFRKTELGSVTYRNPNRSFNSRVYMMDNTKVFVIPTGNGVEDWHYSLQTTSYFNNDASYAPAFYDIDENGFAKVVVLRQAIDAETATLSRSNLKTIRSIGQGVSDDGETVRTLTYVSLGETGTLYVPMDARVSGNKTVADLKPGDVVKAVPNRGKLCTVIKYYSDGTDVPALDEVNSYHSISAVIGGRVVRVDSGANMMTIASVSAAEGDESAVYRIFKIPQKVTVVDQEAGSKPEEQVAAGGPQDILEGDVVLLNLNYSSVTDMAVFK